MKSINLLMKIDTKLIILLSNILLITSIIKMFYKSTKQITEPHNSTLNKLYLCWQPTLFKQNGILPVQIFFVNTPLIFLGNFRLLFQVHWFYQSCFSQNEGICTPSFLINFSQFYYKLYYQVQTHWCLLTVNETTSSLNLCISLCPMIGISA